MPNDSAIVRPHRLPLHSVKRFTAAWGVQPRLGPALAAVILYAAAAGCSSNWPPKTRLLHTDYDSYTPGFPATDGSPRVAGDSAGNFVAIWAGNSASQQTGGADCPTGNVKNMVIYTARSVDKGANWAFPKCLKSGVSHGVPALASDGSGTWVAAWQSSGGVAGNDGDIFTSRSTDKSWAAPAPAHPWSSVQALNTNALKDSGWDSSPDVIWVKAGLWLAVWSSTEPLGNPSIGTDADILFSRSSDGLTWTAPQVLNTNATGDSGNDLNPRLAADAQGNLVAVWTSNDPLGTLSLGTDGDIVYARSSDGISWTPPAALNSGADKDTANDTAPAITSGNGFWTVAWASSDPSSTSNADSDILVSYATGSGASWQPSKRILGTMNTDKGNDVAPQIAYGANKWFVVWQTDEDIAGSGSDNDIAMAQSYDGGASWYSNAIVHDSGKSDMHGDVQPHLATDGKNHWVIVWSSEYPGPAGANWGLDYDILDVGF